MRFLKLKDVGRFLYVSLKVPLFWNEKKISYKISTSKFQIRYFSDKIGIIMDAKKLKLILQI
jgi:hypothetical protein